MRRFASRAALLVVIALVVLSVVQIGSVALYRSAYDEGTADCAIVLGAAIWNRKPSPVFRERIRFGVDLAQRGKVRALIFTGGIGAGDTMSEGRVGRDEAVRAGIAPARVFFEERSHTTFQNLVNARDIILNQKFSECYLVSDGPHLKRASIMAADLGLKVKPAATPTTRFKSLYARVRFVVVEAYYIVKYRVREQSL